MAWGTSNCGKHTHYLYVQQREESCAIACILTALQRKNRLNGAGAQFRRREGTTVTNKALTEDEARVPSQKYGGTGYYRPSAKDAGAKTDDVRFRMISDMMLGALGSEGTGTCLPNVARTLTALGVNARYQQGVSWSQVVSTAGKNVVISCVRWRGGGGHAILLEKVMTKLVFKGVLLKRQKTSICVCDPIFGAHRVLLAGNKKPICRPGQGSAGAFASEMVVL